MKCLTDFNPRQMYHRVAKKVDDFAANIQLKVLERRLGKRVLYKKFGYEHQESGPDHNEVPHHYNLTLANRKKIMDEWFISPSAPFELLRKREDQNWERFSEDHPIETLKDVMIRPRVDAIMMSTISDARSKGRKGRDEGAPIHVLANRRGQSGADLLVYTSKRVINMPFKNDKGLELQLTSQIDNVLWSGNPDELDASLLILRAPTVGTIWSWTLLKNMAMIHHARKKAGRNAEIYGIATDTHSWAFLRIDNKSQYSRWFLDWKYDEEEIVDHVVRIVDYAAGRAVQAAWATRQPRTASQITGCTVTHPKTVFI
ncbi:hypothetical protein BDW59DRAFT_156177 [Aspergillus cavernicola]|uniref:Uncharacterized protein n=1 Tax=Aspergillus cavernicola TaxID=176166 RepID=A0ABR4J5A6_9EURO